MDPSPIPRSPIEIGGYPRQHQLGGQSTENAGACRICYESRRRPPWLPGAARGSGCAAHRCWLETKYAWYRTMGSLVAWMPGPAEFIGKGESKKTSEVFETSEALE
jgi:hypothetical protein